MIFGGLILDSSVGWQLWHASTHCLEVSACAGDALHELLISGEVKDLVEDCVEGVTNHILKEVT